MNSGPDFRVNRKRGHGRVSEAHEYVWKRHFKLWEKKKVSDISYKMARKMILDIRKTAPIHGNRVQRLGKAIWNHGINELRMKGIGECKAMRWVDVDLQSGLWVIPDTKSGEAQTCVLPKPMVDLLTERKPKGKGKSEWVYPTHSKSGHVEAINTAWEQVRFHGMTKKERTELKRLHKKGVSGEATPEQVLRETKLRNKAKFQHLQARDLRGTLASWLQEAGVPLVGAQQQLGHADISTTAGSYTTISHSLQRIGLDSATAAMLEAAK